jgi:hypothetical protein
VSRTLFQCPAQLLAILDRLLPVPNVSDPDRPIFLVGCGKSGTSILGLLFFAHPDVGPKAAWPQPNSSYRSETLRCRSEKMGARSSANETRDSKPSVVPATGADVLQAQLNSMTSDSVFGPAATAMEQKDTWDRFFPIRGVDLRIGKELTLLRNPLSWRSRRRLIARLTKNLAERRFFNKAPFNTFRVHAIRELFPNAKLIAIHRDGRDVVGSWGRKQNRWQHYGGHKNAIQVMSRKWMEAVDHIERYREELDIKTIRYEQLVADPQAILRDVMDFCELPYRPELYDGLNLTSRSGMWRERIPSEFHTLLTSLTEEGRQKIAA